MKKFILYSLIFISLTTLCFGESAPYLQKKRVAYITSVLEAFSKTRLQTIFNVYSYINVVDKNSCQSSIANLHVECLLNYSRANCRGTRNRKARKHCELYSDIIVVNKLSEKLFVSRSERFKMMKHKSDFRAAMIEKLQQKYSRLAAQFSLTKLSDCEKENQSCLAKGIDQFCLDYTNKKSLSWQYCVSSLVWFIGTAKK